MKKLPFFPMNLVAFPEERLNLHIDEPRYKQLINDCLESKSPFGIPAFINKKLEYGTQAVISEVVKVYDDGAMDIRVRGKKPFRIMDFENPLDGKLYSGGTVEFLDLVHDADPLLNVKIIDLAMELFEWLEVHEQVLLNIDTVLYDIIHNIGLRPEEEYYLLSISSETERQEYVISHLQNLIPALKRAEEARQKIRMNGHFDHIDPINF